MSWIDANLHLTLYLIPLFAFAEACIGIGLFVSGVFLVVICSLAFDQQLASLPLITLLAFVGALLGDHVGYYIGKSFGPHFHRMSIVQKRREAISKAEDMIKRYGPFAVFKRYNILQKKNNLTKNKITNLLYSKICVLYF